MAIKKIVAMLSAFLTSKYSNHPSDLLCSTVTTLFNHTTLYLCLNSACGGTSSEENDELFKVTQAYSEERNPSAPIRSRT